MTPDDLTRPLAQAPRKTRLGIALAIVAGTLSGSLSGLAIFWAVVDANSLRGKRVLPVPAPQPALADSVQQTAPAPPPVQAVPTAKTITLTVIDSQTGAKREVVLPAPTNDQPEGESALRSTMAASARDRAPAQAVARRAAKKR